MNDTEKKNLRLVQKHLRRMGFKRCYKSETGSQYYRLTLAQPFRAKKGHVSLLESIAVDRLDVRVSSHSVPWSLARQDGDFSWHDNDLSLNSVESRVQCLKWLAWVRDCVRAGALDELDSLSSLFSKRV
jgi:hypothetical protein